MQAEILPGIENTNYISLPFFLQEVSADLNHTAEKSQFTHLNKRLDL